MKVDIVMEGGGAKGTALVGALQAIRAQGFEFSRVAGASAGAITASVVAAGYTPEEIRKVMMEVDYTDFQDGSRWKIKRIFDVFRHLGMHKGDVFHTWIREILDEKNVVEFGDLSIEGETDPRYRWKLKLIVSDNSKQRMLVFPNDGILFDIDPDRIKVADAVRASMAIPFYFRPVRMEDSYLVDGGMLSNFPIWVFDADGEPRYPTFGLLLQEVPHPIGDFMKDKGGFKRAFSFGKSLVDTMMRAHDRRFVRPGDFKYRTIPIDVGNVKTTEFDLSFEKKEWLDHQGKKAVNAFLNDWEWEKYKEWSIKARN